MFFVASRLASWRHPSHLVNGSFFFVWRSSPARLDDQVREQMLQESLDQFLDDRVSKIIAGEGDSLDPLHYDLEP